MFHSAEWPCGMRRRLVDLTECSTQAGFKDVRFKCPNQGGSTGQPRCVRAWRSGADRRYWRRFTLTLPFFRQQVTSAFIFFLAMQRRSPSAVQILMRTEALARECRIWGWAARSSMVFGDETHAARMPYLRFWATLAKIPFLLIRREQRGAVEDLGEIRGRSRKLVEPALPASWKTRALATNGLFAVEAGKCRQ